MSECENVELAEYDMGLHIASVFLIIGVSAIGTLIPVLGKTKFFQMDKYLFLVIKCFGIGVILATSFIHMFIPAAQTLTNPCLPPVFTETYPAFAGVIALVSVLTIQLIQTLAVLHFSSPRAVNSHDPAKHNCDDNADSSHLSAKCVENGESIAKSSDKVFRKKENVVELGALKTAHNIHSDNCCPVEHAFSKSEHSHDTITTFILEFGIAIHSVLIGIALGVTTGDEFVPLLIAICFHQFFEGFALSTTALDAGFKTLLKPILMASFYSFTTPLGIVLGIAIRNTFNPNDTTSLIVQGSLDSIAAGILIYDSLVNLITTNITHGVYFASLPNAKRVWVFVSLWMGAMIMSIIGLWA
jgi:zinc transporter 1/2/3